MKYLIPLALLMFAAFSSNVLSANKGSLQTTGIYQQGNVSTPRPTRAQTKDDVLAEFGEPNKKLSAVGEPPISRWEYDKFNVFFEFDVVIHSVLKK